MVLTETNVPDGFCYVRTVFYGKKTTTSNRTQISYPYTYNSNIKKSLYTRIYVNGIGWSNWYAIGGAKTADYTGLFENGAELKESGWVTITPSAASTPTAVNVAFKKTYKNIPVVITSVASGAIGTQVLGTSTNGITKTSANIVLTRTNTIATTVYYFIIGEVV